MRFISTPRGGGSRKLTRFHLLLGLMLMGVLAFAIASLASVGSDAGFEDNDANLVTGANMDWNGFAPVTWTGTAPKRSTSTTVDPWSFSGFEDYTATNSDDGFAGGIKQDTDCAKIIGTKAPNKDDLKRVYIASASVPVVSDGGKKHVFLELGFVRIPLNSTQSSTHIGFEFNEKKLGACPASANADGLVKRTPQAWGGNPAQSGGDPTNPGDLLIVYDYEGSTTSPTLTLRHWIDSNTTLPAPFNTCEISNDSPPCWSTAQNLTAAGFAEAQVNFGANGVDGAGIVDALAPNAQGNSSNETLGLKEFGEAGIDLTKAGVFGPNVCTGFGQADAVSRSSGNSGNAAMEDLVAGPVNISNCGEIKIIKQTNPRGLDKKFAFTSDLPANSAAGGDSTPTCGAPPPNNPPSGIDANGNFCLNDKNNGGKTLGSFLPADNLAPNNVDSNQLQAGTYHVTEGADPTGFAFDSVKCKVNGVDATLNTQQAPKTVTINLKANDVVVCIYQNNQQLGAIKLTKTSSKPAADTLSGAHLRICTNGTDGGDFVSCTTAATGSDDLQTGSNGTVCVGDLPFGDYFVSEKSGPAGYAIDDSKVHKVTVDNNAKCSDNPFVGEPFTFKDTPLTDLILTITSEATGGTKSGAKCVDGSSNNIGNSPQPTGANLNDVSTFGNPVTVQADPAHGGGLKPGTYTCTVVIDP
jgi:hypothetical protein